MKRQWFRTRLVLATAAVLAATLLLAAPALATDFPVNSDATLRSAITSAGDGDTITFTGDITLTGDLPAVQSNVTIVGQNHTLSGNNQFRGFFVGKWTAGTITQVPVTVGIQNLTIQNANAQGGSGAGMGGGGAGFGGAIFVANLANVTVSNVGLNSNTATGGTGGSTNQGGGGGGMGGNGGGIAGAAGGGGGGIGSGASGGSGISNGQSGIATGASGGGGGSGGGTGGSSGGGGAGGNGSGANAGGGGVGGGGGGGSGGSGGFGGGGGGTASGANGGSGGFGGGGGGALFGGSGGFGGGGAGANGGSGGFGGGAGTGGVGGGGGGLGAGGAIFVQQGGSITLAGPVTVNGNAATAGSGGPGAGNGSAFGSAIFVQGNDASHGGAGSLTFSPASGQTQSVANAIADQTGSGGSGGDAGAWGLTKSGAGTLTLLGTNTYTGLTSVNAGTLAVNGSLNSGGQGALVSSGATLAGTGTIGDVGVLGTLAPGNSVGTLHTGDVVMSALSPHYAVEIDSGGADRVDATGTANISAASLDLTLLGGYVHTPGTVYTILTATGGVSGTFVGLPDGATVSVGGSMFTIDYTANAVLLTAQKASPNLATNASAGVPAGGSVHDTATLSGGSNPTGTITYRLYGPNDSSCSGSPALTDTKTVNGNGSYDSSSFTATAVGTYRWTASYSGDSNNDTATSACNAVNESVTVGMASPTLATNASAGVVLGGSVHDTGTLAGGSSPSGEITFNLYGPNDSNCSGSPAFTDTKTVSGNASYDSSSFTPTQVGTYRWTSSYSGDANNNPASSACNAANESVSVSAAPPTLTTSASPGVELGGSVHDTATLAGGSSPTGKISFRLYGPNDSNCSGTPASTATKTVSGNGAYRSAEFTPTALGTYRWRASYSGDSSNDPAAGACNEGSESVVVSKAAPSLTTNASPNVVIGARVDDTATLAGGQLPTGHIYFRLYRPGDTDCSQKPVFGDRLAAFGNRSYRSARFLPRQPGIYHWRASYTGDANNKAAFAPCSSRKESVWVQKASPTLATTAKLTAAGRILDAATLAHGRNPAGQLAFKLYGPNDSDCSQKPVFGDRVQVSGNGRYRTDLFTPTKPGTYRFTALLPGDDNNRGASSACNAAGESVRVAAG